jgi:2-oxo-4-hydroxy-4-carboxy--5-ureidoimidazoline (OHCU) decarboxylase
MPLTRVEQIAALSLFAKPDYKELGWLIETTKHLTPKQKVTALAATLRLALDRDDTEAREALIPLLADTSKIIRLPNAETATG